MEVLFNIMGSIFNDSLRLDDYEKEGNFSGFFLAPGMGLSMAGSMISLPTVRAGRYRHSVA